MGCFQGKMIEEIDNEKKIINHVMQVKGAPTSNSLKKYKIKSVIKNGVYSSMLHVENKLNSVPFAIRVFELKYHEHWKNEIFALRRIKHDNIVQLIEIFNHKQKKFLVYEYAGGGNLKDKISSNINLSEIEIAKIIRKILSAVYYLHLLGITHRDINPGNILFSHIGPNAKLMLSNFRSCCHSHPSNFISGLYGLPEYTAPEMKSGKYKNYVDIWSVGIILYELYFGSLPSFNELVNMNSPRWAKFSNLLVPFAKNLFNIDPSQRFTAQEALMDKYIRVLSIKNEECSSPSDESVCSMSTNSVSKSSASWRISVYSN